MALCIYAYHAVPILKHAKCSDLLAKVKKKNFRSWEWLAFPGSWHPKGALNYLNAPCYEMGKHCGVRLDNTIFVDCLEIEHLFNTPRGTRNPHIGTHSTALEKMLQNSGNVAILRDALEKVHRLVYQSGCPSTGAVVCFCKWGKHRSSYGWWGA